AVPTLIALLTEASSEDLDAIEAALSAVAGFRGPQPPIEDGPAVQQKFRKSWEDWWDGIEDIIDLTNINPRRGRGYTLAILRRPGTPPIGTVQETDRIGRVRWAIGTLSFPIWASIAGRHR